MSVVEVPTVPQNDLNIDPLERLQKAVAVADEVVRAGVSPYAIRQPAGRSVLDLKLSFVADFAGLRHLKQCSQVFVVAHLQ